MARLRLLRVTCSLHSLWGIIIGNSLWLHLSFQEIRRGILWVWVWLSSLCKQRPAAFLRLWKCYLESCKSQHSSSWLSSRMLACSESTRSWDHLGHTQEDALVCWHWRLKVWVQSPWVNIFRNLMNRITNLVVQCSFATDHLHSCFSQILD